MAEYSVDLGDDADVKRWSQDVLRETIPKTLSQTWRSSTGTSPLHVQSELNKAEGSSIKFFLRAKGAQAGVKGDEELEGKEEGATFHMDTLNIDQLRLGYRTKGRMTQQRVPWKIVSELKDLGSEGWSERLDTMFFNLACGNTAQTDDRYSGLHGIPTAPTSGRIFRPGGVSADESLGTSHFFDLDLLDTAVNQAKIASPQIRPVKTDGGEFYIAVLHPNTVRFLRKSETLWFGHMRAAMQGGAVANNPLFSGALGASNGCVFYESNYITDGVDSSTSTLAVTNAKRNVLLGAQAICMGYGKGYGPGGSQFDMVMEDFDYKNQVGVGIGMIFGMKKTVFNSQDYGIIVMPSYAPDPS